MKRRRDPSPARQAQLVDDLFADLVRAQRDGDLQAVQETGNVLADLLEEAQFPNAAADLRAYLERPTARLIDSELAVRIDRAATELHIGNEPLIHDPNSSGQGYSTRHRRNPFHDDLVVTGYVYAYTTPIPSAQARPHELFHRYVIAEGLESQINRVTVVEDLRRNDDWHWMLTVEPRGRRFGVGRQHISGDRAKLVRLLSEHRAPRKRTRKSR